MLTIFGQKVTMDDADNLAEALEWAMEQIPVLTDIDPGFSAAFSLNLKHDIEFADLLQDIATGLYIPEVRSDIKI